MNRGVGLVAAMALLGAACATVLGLEHLPGETSQDDAGATVDGNAACDGVNVPPEPPRDRAGGDGNTFWTAFRTFDLGIDQARRAVGYNLDRTCSTTIATSSCRSTIDQPTFDKFTADRGDAGIDDTSVVLMGDLGLLSPAFNPTEIDARLKRGDYGMVVRVRNYNGAAEDTAVDVELFPTIGVTNGSGGSTPNFDRGDVWRRDARFTLYQGSENSKNRAAKAYVSGGKLTAFFAELVLPFRAAEDPKPFDLRLRETWLTARVAADGDGFRLDEGVIAGRYRTVDFLSEVLSIYVEHLGALRDFHVCDEPGKPVYGAIKQQLCPVRDLRGSEREDRSGSSCDAVSFVVRFDAPAAGFQDFFFDGGAFPPRCVDAATPLGDDCAE